MSLHLYVMFLTQTRSAINTPPPPTNIQLEVHATKPAVFRLIQMKSCACVMTHGRRVVEHLRCFVCWFRFGGSNAAVSRRCPGTHVGCCLPLFRLFRGRRADASLVMEGFPLGLPFFLFGDLPMSLLLPVNHDQLICPGCALEPLANQQA
jgi:hypothetical protein